MVATQPSTSDVGESAIRIFYAEDDDDIRLLVSIILRSAGFVTDEYADGSSAFAALEDSAAHLYLLDVRMPGKDGLQLCRHLRATRPATTPIMMISAEKTEANVSDALAAGADAFLGKPFSRRQLLGQIEELLRRDDGNGP